MVRAAFNANRLLHAARIRGLFLAALLLTASSGCSLLETCGCISAPPPAPVNEVIAFIYDQVQFVSDSANHGRPLPGLVGRVYLSHAEENKSNMVEASGMMVAEMFDATPGKEPRKLADWRFDKESLKQLKKRDLVGMGYTLFLPWENYDPAIKKVQVRVWYEEPGKASHFAEPQILALKSAEQAPIVQRIDYEYAPAQRAGLLPTPK
jgi:hypothetical protein